jgi:hypothetical protein
MSRYRKKPVEIEAVRWIVNNEKEVMDFIFSDDRWKVGLDSPYVDGPGIGVVPALGTLDIPTLEGVMTAQPGDWIIRGVQGELYPCKPHIFVATYEPVEPNESKAALHGQPYEGEDDAHS